MMTFDELLESYGYIGRCDALLAPQPDLTPEALWEALHDTTFISQHSLHQPLYSIIPYMLVTLELFVGCPYLKQQVPTSSARHHRLNLSLGKVEIPFQDPLVGLISEWAQRWIDRNFSFDYTLKSLQKISSSKTRDRLRDMRLLIKDAAYMWLGHALVASTGDTSLLRSNARPMLNMTGLLGKDHALDSQATSLAMASLSDRVFTDLREKIDAMLPITLQALEHKHVATLDREYGRWVMRSGWELLHVDS